MNNELNVKFPLYFLYHNIFKKLHLLNANYIINFLLNYGTINQSVKKIVKVMTILILIYDMTNLYELVIFNILLENIKSIIQHF